MVQSIRKISPEDAARLVVERGFEGAREVFLQTADLNVLDAITDDLGRQFADIAKRKRDNMQRLRALGIDLRL